MAAQAIAARLAASVRLVPNRTSKALSPSGVVGDARVATKEKGEKLLAAISARMAEVLLNLKLWA